jgi:putative CocE/NonD family hydrolase
MASLLVVSGLRIVPEELASMQPQQPSVTVDFDVPATVRDGIVLRANVYRPAGEARWPVLLTRLPYGKDAPRGDTTVDAVQAARRGYVVVVQDTRGSGASDGDWDPFRPEADDGEDTVAWAAGLPYSDGQVGMYGLSYFGFTQHAAAVRQPPALTAIAPFVTFVDPLNGLVFRGGAFELGLWAHWTFCVMHPGVLVRRHAEDPAALGGALAAWAAEADALGPTGYAALPLAGFAPLRRHDAAPAFFAAVAAPMDPSQEPVASGTITGSLDRIRTPAYYVGGWYDIFLGDTLAGFAALRAQGTPAKLLVGPWSHRAYGNPVGEVNFGTGADAGFVDLQTDARSLQLRWFDHWLKKIDTGMLAEPPVRLFVMGANVWRDEDEWPLARAVDTPWYLRADGGLSPEPPGAEAPDRYAYDPADPVPTRGGATMLTPEYPAGPVDQRPLAARPDVLVYLSGPLSRDTEVTGPIAVHLWAASSAPDTDFVARLVDVAPDGRSLNLADGIVRARYRGVARGEAPSPFEPGRPYEYAIDLWATSNVFKAGHRIGLHVTSSSFPRWDRNPNTGHPFGADAEVRVARQEILHDREHLSRVILPVVAT